MRLRQSSAPQVSVLMPVRDALGTLPEAVGSILSQTLLPIELVAVDDGSTDGTGAWLAEAALRDPRVRVLSPGSVGLVRALNLGLQACRAPFVARMDADDLALPTRLEAQLALARGDGLAMTSCLVETFGAHGVGEGYRLYDQWVNALVTHEQIDRQRFVESPLPHPSVLLERDAVLVLGGYRDTGWPEDYDLWLRMLAAGHRAGKVPEVLLRWRDHAGRHSRTHGRYAHSAFLACKAHHLARGPLAAGQPFVIWGAGPVGKRLGRALEAEGARAAAYVDIDPRKMGRTRRGRQVVPPADLARYDGALVLVAVGTRGARALINADLAGRGYREGEGFLCAA